jgi:SAM-dependent methyltransferase
VHLEQIQDAIAPQVPPALPLEWFSSAAQYRAHLERAASAGELDRRESIESALISRGQNVPVDAFCYPCRRLRILTVAGQTASGVNWREDLQCPTCGLVNRMRASWQIFVEHLQPPPGSRVYVTEQVTPLFRHVRNRFPNAIGSEYVGGAVPLGRADPRGLRNEDLTRLTFGDGQFDYVLSFEVFEHIPDFRRAFAECARVLSPGGRMCFSVPFRQDLYDHVIHASVMPDGSVEHHHPPEIHGDPLSDGCLCFQHFGWRLLDDLADAGFSNASACGYWSRDLGYLGGHQLQFVAMK